MLNVFLVEVVVVVDHSRLMMHFAVELLLLSLAFIQRIHNWSELMMDIGMLWLVLMLVMVYCLSTSLSCIAEWRNGARPRS